MTYLARSIPLFVLLAACGPDKGGSAGGSTTGTSGDPVTTDAPGTTTTGSTGTAPTTGDTDHSMTGLIPCDAPPPAPDTCNCSPDCGGWQCGADEIWTCTCESCSSTSTGTDTSTGTSTDTGLIPCNKPPPPPDDCPCGPDECSEVQCMEGNWACECLQCPDTTTGGLEVDCGQNPPVFPPFHNPPCMTDDECTVGIHQINCCGTFEAWGIAVADADAFTAAEATCEAQYPLCDCAALPTKADDGGVGDGPDAFAAICDKGACVSVTL